MEGGGMFFYAMKKRTTSTPITNLFTLLAVSPVLSSVREDKTLKRAKSSNRVRAGTVARYQLRCTGYQLSVARYGGMPNC
jgi:hypothetical protein